MIKEAIAKVITKTNLTEAEAEAVMREIMQGEATDAQIASYITALRMKGETVEEITGLRPGHAREGRADQARRANTRSTPAAPAATWRIRSTSPRPPPSSSPARA